MPTLPAPVKGMAHIEDNPSILECTGFTSVHFVDRYLELGILDDLHRRSGAQFLVHYGRRLVGKTRLLTY